MKGWPGAIVLFSEIRLATDELPDCAAAGEISAVRAADRKRRRNMDTFIGSVIRGTRVNVHPKIHRNLEP